MATNRNSGYSPSELTSMQRDAMDRVREMQRKARERVEQTNRIAAGYASSPPPPRVIPTTARDVSPPPILPPPRSQQTPPPPVPAAQPAGFSLEGILDRLNLDGDTLLIMGLLLLLANDGSDQMLVLALVYLLL